MLLLAVERGGMMLMQQKLKHASYKKPLDERSHAWLKPDPGTSRCFVVVLALLPPGSLVMANSTRHHHGRGEPNRFPTAETTRPRWHG